MRRKPLIRILLVDGTEDALDAIGPYLSKEEYAIRTRRIGHVRALAASLEDHVWDLILFACGVGDEALERAISLVKQSGQDVPFVVLYRAADGPPAELITFALRAGATDAVERDNAEHLYYAIRKELMRLGRRREARNLRLTLKRYEARYRYLLRSSTDAIACIDTDNHIFATKNYIQIFGMDEFPDIKAKSIAPRGSQMGGPPDGVAGLAGNAAGAATPATDQTFPTAVQHERQSGFLPQDDFEDVVEKSIRLAVNKNAQSALLYLELDNFDKLASSTGDRKIAQYLLDVADLILATIAPDDAAARLEPDTFAILLCGKSLSHANAVADDLSREVKECSAAVSVAAISLGCNVGVVPISGTQSSYTELIVNGFSACHTAKRSGDGNIGVHATDEHVSAQLESSQHLMREVLEALDRQRFSLVYQPIVRLSGEPVELYEVLLRVDNRFGGEIPAEAVFPIARKHELSTVIDEWVIEHALPILGERLAQGHDTHFFIKLSKEAVRDERIVLRIAKQLRRNRIPGNKLILELSETYVVEDAASVRSFLKALKELRCASALEHFGAGINSLKLADDLPVDYLKIDSAFVGHLKGDNEAMAALKAIAHLASRTDKLTIAECVEDAQILTTLFHCGVDFVQGLYIQPPSELLEFDFTSKSIE